jgi:hypothetical protein
MQLTFANVAVEKLCATKEQLVRVFGDSWALVKCCLSLLEVAETLADLATFVTVTIERVRQANLGAVEYLVGLGGIQLMVRALGSISSEGGRDRDQGDLTAVYAVAVISVSRIPAAVAGA